MLSGRIYRQCGHLPPSRSHNLMRALVLMAITAYQRYLSPYKGFCCAYRAHTGRAGCSGLGYRAVRRYGVWSGLRVLRRRMYLCGVAYRRYAPPSQRPHRAQRGDCDFGCDLPCDFNCDLPRGKSCFRFGDLLNCCDCGSCDWPDRKNKGNDQEQYVYIPPKAGSQRK